MPKYHGTIGYTEQYESKPGVWGERIVEREAYGDVLKSSYDTRSTSETTNDELGLSNQISIVANDYAFRNFQYMKYIVFMGVKWHITHVDVQYPRLVLTIGGVYNERSLNASSAT